jgi:hypothetical protein
MKNYFTTEYLNIAVRRVVNNELTVSINSDYSRSSRKSQLYVNEDTLARDVESLWKSIKTKKLLNLFVGFGEIDYYCNMTDVYEVPFAGIKRGYKKVKIGFNQHGSIPKEWNIRLHMTFADTSTKTPIIEAIKKSLGSYFTPKLEKELTKKLKSVLQKKETSLYVTNEES